MMLNYLIFPYSSVVKNLCICLFFYIIFYWSIVHLQCASVHQSDLVVPIYIRASQVVHWQKRNPPVNAGDTRDSGLFPGSERSPGVGNGNPLQYSCLENSMDRRSWQVTVHGVAKSWTQLNTHTHTHIYTYTYILFSDSFPHGLRQGVEYSSYALQ